MDEREEVFNLARRDCNSDIAVPCCCCCCCWLLGVIPSPGTFTPLAARRLSALWLRRSGREEDGTGGSGEDAVEGVTKEEEERKGRVGRGGLGVVSAVDVVVDTARAEDVVVELAVFLRGGNLGGRGGFASTPGADSTGVAAVADGLGGGGGTGRPSAPSRRFGGGGRLAVERPVRSMTQGLGGGGGSLGSDSGSVARAGVESGAGSAAGTEGVLVSEVVGVLVAVPMALGYRFGGGAKVEGSRREERGRTWRVSARF